METIERDGLRVDVAIRVSTRARRARLRVHPDGAAELVVPAGTSRRRAGRLARANADWLVAQVRRRRAAAGARPSLALVRPGALPLQGAWLPVERLPAGGGGAARAELRDGVLRVAGTGPAADLERAVERWYRRHAREIVSEAVAQEGARLGLAPARIAIRDQRTRWASCSSRGTLSFSWRLVLAPPEVLRYVVVHELCHLREANHGPAFWALVERALPDWRLRRDWLRAHGAELHGVVPRLDAALAG